MNGNLYHIYNAERNEHDKLTLERCNRDIARIRHNESTNETAIRAQSRVWHAATIATLIVSVSAGLLILFFLVV